MAWTDGKAKTVDDHRRTLEQLDFEESALFAKFDEITARLEAIQQARQYHRNAIIQGEIEAAT